MRYTVCMPAHRETSILPCAAVLLAQLMLIQERTAMGQLQCCTQPWSCKVCIGWICVELDCTDVIGRMRQCIREYAAKAA